MRLNANEKQNNTFYSEFLSLRHFLCHENAFTPFEYDEIYFKRFLLEVILI